MTYIDHMIAVTTAFKQGKTVQSRRRHHHPGIDACWRDAPEPSWNWSTYDYRVKPAAPRRVWLNVYPTMGCRSSVCYDSREEAASFAIHDIAEQVEFVEVVK